MIESEVFNIPHAELELAGRLHRPQGGARALALISHGLESSKDSEKLTRLAAAMADAGFLALRFDHAGCGDSPGQLSETSLTARRDEFISAVRAMRALDAELPLVYMGSSFGGTVVALAGDIEPPVCSLHWSTPWDFEPLFGIIHDPEGRPTLREMVRDMYYHDIEAVLARTSRAYLVHGQLDEVVPVEQAKRAHQILREPKGLLVLPGADHRLSNLEDQQKALAQSLAWVEQFVKPV
ncbi:MAG: alpha/beta hydrolase [Deltaproteobacteria bacterium]|nr:alpha/beta hydrolase [Deltaproteobacteria bacterium]